MNFIIGYWDILDWCLSEQCKFAGIRRWDKAIKIFDKRESKIVKTFEGIHSSKEFPFHSCCHPLLRFCLLFNLFKLFFHASHFNYRFEIILDYINCVRWNPSGDMIASASMIRQQNCWTLRQERSFILAPPQTEVNAYWLILINFI